MITKSPPDFPVVFARLRAILQEYACAPLKADPDEPGNYTLTGPASAFTRGRPLWFGAVQIKKSYVSYHLMPVYAFPELLEEISPELKKRMQGKSCFNFTRVDEALFAELAALTGRGVQRFRQAGMFGKK
jgi:hypothetical protein